MADLILQADETSLVLQAEDQTLVLEAQDQILNIGIPVGLPGGGGTGEANTGANVGSGAFEWFRDKTGVTLNFRTGTETGGKGVITQVGDTIDWDFTNIPTEAEVLALFQPQNLVFTDQVGLITYVGMATPGTLTSAASWLIFRLDETATGAEELKKEYANASQDFDQIWDNRLILPYS